MLTVFEKEKEKRRVLYQPGSLSDYDVQKFPANIYKKVPLCEATQIFGVGGVVCYHNIAQPILAHSVCVCMLREREKKGK